MATIIHALRLRSSSSAASLAASCRSSGSRRFMCFMGPIICYYGAVSTPLSYPRSLRIWENFRRRVAELGGEVLEVEYLGVQKPHLCRCGEGHECNPTPHHVQRGLGICRICTGRDPVTAWGNFRQRVSELGGEVLEPVWLGARKRHLCRCANGHECSPLPNSVQQGDGICRVCAGRDPVAAWEVFRRRVIELGGTVLEPEWLGCDRPHLCRCVNGHECRPRPSGVQQGAGICQVCTGTGRGSGELAWGNFRRRVADLGGEVLEPKWLGSQQPHRCRCSEGHECKPMPACVQRGQGICPICAGKEWDVLYVTRNPVTRCVKFGITSWGGRARLRDHRYDGYTEVLHLITGLPEGLAAHTEQKIKIALAMVDAKPVRGREYFSDDYLDLIENEISIWVVQSASLPVRSPLLCAR